VEVKGFSLEEFQPLVIFFKEDKVELRRGVVKAGPDPPDKAKSAHHQKQGDRKGRPVPPGALAFSSLQFLTLRLGILARLEGLSFPEQQDRARHKNGRVSPCDNSYEQSEGKIVNHRAAEDEQNHQDDKGRGAC